MSSAAEYRSGFVAIVGEPNVGKSTLINALVGEKVAIVAPKPQTTRNRILGVKTVPNAQIVFIDTPGVRIEREPLAKTLTRTTFGVLDSADAVLFVMAVRFETPRLQRHEVAVLDAVVRAKKPAILVLNKIDLLKRRDALLDWISVMKERHPFAAIVPTSATKGDGLDGLLAEAAALLPVGQQLYPDDAYTDRPERFLVSELVREQVILATRDELPYSVAVRTQSFQEADAKKLVRIECSIFVERDSQKGIIIGRRGQMLRRIGEAARHEIEKLLAHHVFLGLTVKVRENWRDDEGAMRDLGIGDADGEA
ncbi:MAG: GTPase Era [Deltaproteobacteria bacterium]|nr:GTPase Era [Deltaproteobacteria bacterium]